MVALTIWQPWASLVIADFKPYEFRSWDYRTRRPDLVGQRIAIHAGARPVRKDEVAELLDRLERKHSRVSEAAVPFLERLHLSPGMVPLAAVLGTAVLGKPVECRTLFGLVEHQSWAWPLSEIERFPVAMPARGAQGFWRYA